MAINRVPTVGSHNALTSRMMQTQVAIHETQLQVSTGKRSQNYQGISLDAERLINFENQVSSAERYISGNTTGQLRLDTMENSLTAAEKTIRNFRSKLSDYQSLDLTVVSAQEQVLTEQLHKDAFEAMKDLQSYLNIRTEGRYLFAGGKTDTRPVDLGLSTLTAFQTKYGSTGTTYPTTRDAHVGNPVLTNGDTGNIAFNTTGTITAANAGAFTHLPVGASFTVTGAADAGNNQTYTITANTGTVMTVNPVPGAVNAADAGVTVTGSLPNNYYKGDQLELQHRVNEDRSVTLGVNASQGAFEKAFRAMGIIAQDGLESNKDRTNAAMELLNDSLLHDTATSRTSSQYGTLTFTAASNTIKATVPNAFADLGGAGSTFTISGTTSNNGTYTITGNDGTTLTVASITTNEGPLTTAAVDGTSTEPTNDFQTVLRALGRNKVVMDEANTGHQDYIDFLQTRIIDIENIDMVDAATRLNDQINSLDISMRVLARISQLSLSNYI